MISTEKQPGQLNPSCRIAGGGNCNGMETGPTGITVGGGRPAAAKARS